MSIVDDLTKGAVGGVFGGITGLIQVIAGAITGKTPLTAEQQSRLLEQAAALEAQAKQADAALLQGQIDINKIDAASNDPFQRRWRPLIGYLCGAGLFYQFYVYTMFPWTMKVLALIFKNVDFFSRVPDLPLLDATTLGALTAGILGLGGLRTYEKKKGVS